MVPGYNLPRLEFPSTRPLWNNVRNIRVPLPIFSYTTPLSVIGALIAEIIFQLRFSAPVLNTEAY